MIRFLEQTVSQEKTGKTNFLYAVCWFLSIFFLVCAALSASSTLGTAADGSLSFNWIWLIAMIACLALAALAYYGKDYLRLDYDYSITESVVDVSRVLNNKRRKHLAEFDLGKVTSCGRVNSDAFARVKAMPGQTKNNWFIHEDANLCYFAYESKGQRSLTVLELNDAMVQLVKTDRTLQTGAWHD